MKKSWIVVFVCIVLCIAGGSFLIIGRIQSHSVFTQSMEPKKYEELKSFSSLNLDVKTMDVKIEQSDQNGISYCLYDSDKQTLDYSIQDGVLTIKETWKGNEANMVNLKNDQNTVVIYTDLDAISIQGNMVSSDMSIKNLTLNDSQIKTVSGDITGNNVSLKSTTLSSTSGDIELDGKMKVQEQARIETTSGDIDIENIKNVEIQANTTSGDIEIDDADYEKSVSNTIGNKEAVLHLTTTSGDITIN